MRLCLFLVLLVPATAQTVFLDLSKETERQILVDRQQGQYLGHPTTVLLEDGVTMLVVYPKGHGRGPIVLRRSRDAGITWSEPLPVPENWSTSLETPTIHRLVDAAGRKRLVLFSGLYPVRMSVSEDDGASWTPLRPVGSFGGIVTMSSLVRLRDGRYAAFFHDDGRFLRAKAAEGPPRFRVFRTVSRDGGLTWEEPEQILSDPELHWCEPGVVRSPDGTELAMLLRENSRKRNSFVSFSRDEGATWSAPRELPETLTGDRHVAIYAPDGRLVVTFRDMAKNSTTRGDWVLWVGQFDDLHQGGKGQYRVRLADNVASTDCCYAGLERLPDGTLVTLTYGRWLANQPPYLISIRLKLDELDRLARQH